MKKLVLAAALGLIGAPAAQGTEQSAQNQNSAVKFQPVRGASDIVSGAGRSSAAVDPASTYSVFPIVTKWNCAVDAKGKLRDCALLTDIDPQRNFQAAGKSVLRRCVVSAASIAYAARNDNRIAFPMTFFATTNSKANAIGPGMAGVTVGIVPKPVCAPAPSYFGPSPPPSPGYSG